MLNTDLFTVSFAKELISFLEEHFEIENELLKKSIEIPVSEKISRQRRLAIVETYLLLVKIRIESCKDVKVNKVNNNFNQSVFKKGFISFFKEAIRIHKNIRNLNAIPHRHEAVIKKASQMGGHQVFYFLLSAYTDHVFE